MEQSIQQTSYTKDIQPQHQPEKHSYNPNIISNLFATILTNYFQLPIMYYGAMMEIINIIYSFLSSFFTQQQHTFTISSFNYFSQIITDNLNIHTIIQVCLSLLFTFYICKKLYSIVMFYFYNSFYYNKKIIQYKNFICSYIEISDIEKMNIITQYLLQHNLYIDKNISYMNVFNQIYDSRIKLISPYKDVLNLHIPQLHKPLYFEDTTKQIQGYIIWKVSTTKEFIVENEIHIGGIQNTNQSPSSSSTSPSSTHNIIKKSIEVKTSIPYLTMYLTKGNVNTYTDFIFQNHSYNPNTIVKTTYYATNQFNLVLDTITNQQMKSIHKTHKTQFIDTFFHTKKQELWNMVEKVHFHPEYFINNGQYPQISLCLYGPPGTGKSTFAYRIAKALTRNIVVIDLMNIKSSTELQSIFMDHYIQYDGKKLKSNDTVFVLDEFDVAIQYLYAKEQMKNKLKQDFMNTTLDFIKSMKEIVTDTDSESGSVSNKNTKNTTKDTTKETKEPSKPPVDKSLTLNDLLSILQGPCANNGSIIIATTNKFHIIKDICPRLFRDGRLKPYYFGYPTKQLLNEITSFYFKQTIYTEDFNYLNDEEVIPLSQSKVLYTIVNTLIDCNNDTDKAFHKFKLFMKQQFLNNYNEELLSFQEFDS